jgi:hypothetical protein
MVRPSRTSSRIAFTLVLLMAFLGMWYARSNWQIQPEALQLEALATEGDWVDFASTLAEEAIQLFLGLAGG